MLKPTYPIQTLIVKLYIGHAAMFVMRQDKKIRLEGRGSGRHDPEFF